MPQEPHETDYIVCYIVYLFFFLQVSPIIEFAVFRRAPRYSPRSNCCRERVANVAIDEDFG